MALIPTLFAQPAAVWGLSKNDLMPTCSILAALGSLERRARCLKRPVGTVPE